MPNHETSNSTDPVIRRFRFLKVRSPWGGNKILLNPVISAPEEVTSQPQPEQATAPNPSEQLVEESTEANLDYHGKA